MKQQNKETDKEKDIEREKVLVKQRVVNEIEIGDFRILSTTSRLKDVEQTINRLIDKHRDFAEARSKLNVMRMLGVN